MTPSSDCTPPNDDTNNSAPSTPAKTIMRPGMYVIFTVKEKEAFFRAPHFDFEGGIQECYDGQCVPNELQHWFSELQDLRSRCDQRFQLVIAHFPEARLHGIVLGPTDSSTMNHNDKKQIVQLIAYLGIGGHIHSRKWGSPP